MNKFTEIIDEFRENVFQQGGFLDLLPPFFFFLAFRYLELNAAFFLTVLFLAALLLYRFKTKSFSFWTVLGLVGMALALIYAWRSGNIGGLLLPDIVSDLVLSLLCLVSLLIKRPLVALTSHLVRRWPLGWYRHPRVRPAYREVTLVWAVYFILRFLAQWFFFRTQSGQKLLLLNMLTGWPALVVLLVVSYLYGLRRLKRLAGPSVEEYRQKKKPPWQSQQKGF